MSILPSDLERTYRATGLVPKREYQLFNNCPDCSVWALHYFEYAYLIHNKCWVLVRSCRYCDQLWDEKI